ncbi:hypothetical protein SAMN02745823_03219 [Sporobacter termitidis DSM 10068]|uniref:Lipoprotein n=1 Tax=Sporobacter termitidis DSM 10068 TaxID=1123282 RepID=A0A1M5Z4I1_9FIRM|nr:hypothetical protein [Sporobacter termitidis]SHI19165.1 hypothetical protein SAMN02745823_03219 [Sporobacter termitidis DSM 10068]
MPKRPHLLLTMCLLLLLTAGCGERGKSDSTPSGGTDYAATVNEEDMPSASSVQQLTEDCIGERYDKAENITYEDYKNADDIGYLAFSYDNDGAAYYGFTVAEQEGDRWKLYYFEDYPNDGEAPVAITQFIGTYPGVENMKLHITAGRVNDEHIRNIVLYYPKADIKVIYLDTDQRGFIDIKINSVDSLTKIDCKSSTGKIIYSRDFDKS